MIFLRTPFSYKYSATHVHAYNMMKHFRADDRRPWFWHQPPASDYKAFTSLGLLKIFIFVFTCQILSAIYLQLDLFQFLQDACDTALDRTIIKISAKVALDSHCVKISLLIPNMFD